MPPTRKFYNACTAGNVAAAMQTIHVSIPRLRYLYQRLQGWLILSLTVLVLTIASHPVEAQQNAPTGSISSANVAADVPAADLSSANVAAGNQIDGYPVSLNGKELFRVKQGIPGVVSAAERAKVINARITQIANDDAIAPDAIRVEEQETGSVILAGDTVLFTVRDNDRMNNQSRQESAAKSIEIIRSAVSQYRYDHSVEQIARGIFFAVLSTIILVVFLILLQRFISRLLTKIRAARQADMLDIRIQNFQLFGSNATCYLLTGLVSLLRLALILASLYLYIPFVLSQFPATRAIGNSIFSDIADRISQAVTAFVQYLPNLVMIGLIAVLTHYMIQFAKLVITELGRDDAYPWFYPEWIQPTNRLATILLVALGCIITAPYLPGFNSPAFQGISLFLGALFTLGSSSAIANAIAGIILIYTRAFRIGDIIQIGEITGKVVEKSLFVSRLLTFKQEVITIPNASVLNSNVINFNAVSRINTLPQADIAPHEFSNYLLLHTTITLGYDVPWRKIHEVLIQAAKATSGIVLKPYPFVLQTALNDYNVSYELNVYTNHPEIMPQIYSSLHQNIQDYCNQSGIEILSPAYTSIRDGNHSTIPENYLPEDYTSPTFQIRNQNNHS